MAEIPANIKLKTAFRMACLHDNFMGPLLKKYSYGCDAGPGLGAVGGTSAGLGGFCTPLPWLVFAVKNRFFASLSTVMVYVSPPAGTTAWAAAVVDTTLNTGCASPRFSVAYSATRVRGMLWNSLPSCATPCKSNSKLAYSWSSL